MENAKLFPMEYRFMQIIWEAQPLSAGRLAILAEGRLGWKRTTSYTVLKRLTDRGWVIKQGKLVSALLTKDEADEAELSEICDRCFGGDRDAMKRAVDLLSERPKETHSPQ